MILVNAAVWGTVAFMGFCRAQKLTRADSLPFALSISLLTTSSLAMAAAPLLWHSEATCLDVTLGVSLAGVFIASARFWRDRGEQGDVPQV